MDQWANVTWYERSGDRWIEQQGVREEFSSESPFPAPAVARQPAGEAFQAVLAQAGAKVRDANDLRVIREVRNHTKASE
jgi:hypothetical protein